MTNREKELFRALFTLRIRPEYADVVPHDIRFSTACPFNCYTVEPDMSNFSIADVIGRLMHRTPTLKAFAQFEQWNILSGRGFGDDRLIQAPMGGQGAHITTPEFCEWVAAETSKCDGDRRILVAGHPHHVRRVAALLRYYGLEPYVLRVSRHIPYDASRKPGYQWWTISRWRYIPWEYASRVVILLKCFFGKL